MMDGHAHHWGLSFYESGVSLGRCRCGAQRYFADWPDKETVARANELNRELGYQDFKFHHGRNPLYECGTGTKNEEIKEKEMNQEGQGGVVTTASPVPPRPETMAMNKGEAASAMKGYFDRNKEAIIADYERLGERETLKRWNINESTWRTLRARLMPERFDFPAWYLKGNSQGKAEKTREVITAAPAVDGQADVKPTQPVLLRQYYDRHHEEIIRDIESLGATAARDKWGFAWNGWNKFLSRWDLADKLECAACGGKAGRHKQGCRTGGGLERKRAAKLDETGRNLTKPDEKGNDPVSGRAVLPEFPKFDGMWSTETQIEWLRAYRDMAVAR